MYLYCDSSSFEHGNLLPSKKFTTDSQIAQILIACGVSTITQIERIPNLCNRACDAITRICGICVSVVDNHLTQSIFKR